jgi:ankyrin repeat protein
MTKRTNWVAWGLVALLGVVLLGGAGVTVYYQLRRQHLNDALMEAISQGNSSAVLRLLSAGADPNSRAVSITGVEVPALIAAADNGHTEIVQLLLERGASIDTKTTGRQMMSGQTALSQVAAGDKLGVMVGFLLAKGAAVNTRDDQRMTPLHYAAWRGNSAATRLLLKAGAEVNAVNVRGQTPLAFALKGQRLSSGKRTAEQRRVHPLFTATVQLLKQAGGKT